jgi:hypothetical protein
MRARDGSCFDEDGETVCDHAYDVVSSNNDATNDIGNDCFGDVDILIDSGRGQSSERLARRYVLDGSEALGSFACVRLIESYLWAAERRIDGLRAARRR